MSNSNKTRSFVRRRHKRLRQRL